MNRYLIILEKTATGFSAYSPDLPGCIATGKSYLETEAEMKSAIEFHIEGLREAGYEVPQAATQAAYCEVAAPVLIPRPIMKRLLNMLMLVVMASVASGCFSAMTKGLDGSSGDQVKAGALDLATLPIQVPVLAGAALGYPLVRVSEDRKRTKEDTEKELLRRDPEIVFREKWHTDKAAQKYVRLVWSFHEASVPYTDEMLRRIFAESTNGLREYVFCHPACSTNFLIEEYFKAAKECEAAGRGYACFRLSNIFSNTNTPTDLLVSIAETKTMPQSLVIDAKNRLEDRRRRFQH